MCTPVYVTVKMAGTMAPMVSYLFGTLVLAVGSVISFAKAAQIKKALSKITPTRT